MTDLEIRILDMLKSVLVFESRYRDYFAPGSLARELFDAIRQAVDELETYAAAESAAGGSKLQNTAGRFVAREVLRQKLEAIRLTARAMTYTTPGLEDKFRVPRNASDQVLINTGRAFVLEATPLKAEFIRHEMPANFLEDLNAAIDALENAIRGQKASKGARKSAGTSIDGTVEHGVEAVRRLHPIVRNKFADQPSVLAEWEAARHIKRGPRSQPGEGGGDGNTNQPPTP